MPIAFTCQTCGRALRVKDELAGSQIYCPDCKSILTVPAEAQTEAYRPGPPPQEPMAALPEPVPLSAESDPYSTRAEEPAKPAPRKPLLPELDDEDSWDEARPVKSAPAKSPGKKLAQIIGGLAMMVGAVVISIVCFAIGFIPIKIIAVLFIAGIVTFFRGLFSSE